MRHGALSSQLMNTRIFGRDVGMGGGEGAAERLCAECRVGPTWGMAKRLFVQNWAPQPGINTAKR